MKLLQAYRGGYQGRPGWWLHLSYDEDGVQRLKAEIGAGERTWDEEQKRWWVSDSVVDAVLKIVPNLEAYQRQGSLL